MNDPKRMRDGACGDDLRVLVRAAEADVLDEDAVTRLRARLVVAGAIATGATVVAKPPLVHALAAKIAAIACAGAVAAVAVALWPAHRAISVPVAPPPASAPVMQPASPAVTTRTATDVPSISVTDLPRPVVHATTVAQHAQPAPPPAATSPREGLLLLRARHAVATDPASALTLVREHEKEFPTSQLAPERDKIRAEAESKIER